MVSLCSRGPHPRLGRNVVWGAAVCAVAFMAWPVEAQWFPRDHRDRGSTGGSQQVAYDRGYREGLHHGEEDARSGRDFAYEHDRDYQRADDGYDRRHGNRDAYRRVYRDAYATGYREGYSRSSGGRDGAGRAIPRGQGDYGYPGGGRGRSGGYGYGYNEPAFDNGFADGYERGVDDARDGDRYDPLDHGRYRSGDRGYNNRYGSRERYKNVYREGFRAGYDQGYREARVYGRDRGRFGSWWPF